MGLAVTILDPVTGAACAGGACGVTGGGLITGHSRFRQRRADDPLLDLYRRLPLRRALRLVDVGHDRRSPGLRDTL